MDDPSLFSGLAPFLISVLTAGAAALSAVAATRAGMHATTALASISMTKSAAAEVMKARDVWRIDADKDLASMDGRLSAFDEISDLVRGFAVEADSREKIIAQYIGAIGRTMEQYAAVQRAALKHANLSPESRLEMETSLAHLEQCTGELAKVLEKKAAKPQTNTNGEDHG